MKPLSEQFDNNEGVRLMTLCRHRYQSNHSVYLEGHWLTRDTAWSKIFDFRSRLCFFLRKWKNQFVKLPSVERVQSCCTGYPKHSNSWYREWRILFLDHHHTRAKSIVQMKQFDEFFRADFLSINLATTYSLISMTFAFLLPCVMIRSLGSYS